MTDRMEWPVAVPDTWEEVPGRKSSIIIRTDAIGMLLIRRLSEIGSILCMLTLHTAVHIPPPVSEGIRRMMTTLTMLSEQAGPDLIGPQMDGIPADIRGLIPEEIPN